MPELDSTAEEYVFAFESFSIPFPLNARLFMCTCEVEQFVNDNSKAAVAAQGPSLGIAEEEKEPVQVEATGGTPQGLLISSARRMAAQGRAKKNKGARKRNRKMIEAAGKENIVVAKVVDTIQISDWVEKDIGYCLFNFDGLALKIEERRSLVQAIMIFSKFKQIPIDEIDPESVLNSSAGVHGWAEANIDDWQEVTGPLRSDEDWEKRHASTRPDSSGSSMDLPPATEDDRHGEQYKQTKTKDPPESKPHHAATHVTAYSGEIEARGRELRRQQEKIDAGRKPIGIYKARDVRKVLDEGWTEIKRDHRDAEYERRKAGLHVCLRNRDGDVGPRHLQSAWGTESQGWHQIEVVLDSGAAVSVCPKDMCPQFAMEDFEASKAGVYYTGANGGKLINPGQTHVTVALHNGARALVTFQVADVSRPLVSVSKVCEMGNRVVFGANGGYILNLETGAATQFVKKDGIYVFNMWIPPLSGSPFGRPR